MDERERIARVEAIKQETELTLENRVEALEKLVADFPLIDLDVLTDVHPELLDGRSRQGQEQLNFWRDFYEILDQTPLSTATIRYAEGPESGVCTGFGYKPKTVLQEVWIRVYENLSAADVLFVKGSESGESSKVVIAAPSVLISQTQDLEFVDGPTVLFDAQPPRPDFSGEMYPELAAHRLPHAVHASTLDEKMFIVEDAQAVINRNRRATYPSFYIKHGAKYKAWRQNMLQEVSEELS